jgi:predicted DNA-binding transcriptional regulator AlpA
MRDTIAQTQDAFSGIFIDECKVAELLCQSVRTIQKWRVTGNGPGFYKLGRSVRYQLDEVVAWAEARRKAHTSQSNHDPVILAKHTSGAGPKGLLHV